MKYSFLIFLTMASTALAGEQLPVLAVFEVENRGTPLTADEVKALGGFLAGKLGERGNYRIVPRDEMRARLRSKKQESYRACYDQGCQIEIGRELAANYTVSSTISRLGNTCIITTGMYDLEKAATVKTATAKDVCTSDGMLMAMERVAAKLLAVEQVAAAPLKERSLDTPPRLVSLASLTAGLQFVVMPPVHVGFAEDHELADSASLYLGLDAGFDVFASERFFFGLSARVAMGNDRSIGHITIRSGTGFRLGESFLLAPYLLGGISLWEYPENIITLGWVVGAGATIRYMLGRAFGLSADLAITIDSTDNDENQGEPRAFGVLTHLGVGVYVGF